jgi:hypothetical protein
LHAFFLVDVINEGPSPDVLRGKCLGTNVDGVNKVKKTLDSQVGDAAGNCKSKNFVVGVFGFVKKKRATADDA